MTQTLARSVESVNLCSTQLFLSCVGRGELTAKACRRVGAEGARSVGLSPASTGCGRSSSGSACAAIAAVHLRQSLTWLARQLAAAVTHTALARRRLGFQRLGLQRLRAPVAEGFWWLKVSGGREFQRPGFWWLRVLAAEGFRRPETAAGEAQRRSARPRMKAAWPTCCRSSASTLTRRTAIVTGGSQYRSTTFARSASVSPLTNEIVWSYVASW